MTEPDFSQARKVRSVEEEYQIIGSTGCACGGPLAGRGQSLLTDPTTGLKYDRIDAACARCGATRSFLFDINAFFGKKAGQGPSAPAPSARGCIILLWVVAAAAAAGSALAWTKGETALGVIASCVTIFLVWLGWGSWRPARSTEPPTGVLPPESGEDMVQTLAALGIPLQGDVGDPKLALVGGAFKAGIYRGCRALREGKRDEAVSSLTAALRLIEGQAGPGATPLMAVAFRLRGKAHEESGRAADALSDYERTLALDPGDREAQDGKARLSGKVP